MLARGGDRGGAGGGDGVARSTPENSQRFRHFSDRFGCADAPILQFLSCGEIVGAREIIAVACIGAGFPVASGPAIALTEADRSSYAAAVAYCRSKPGQLVLNEEKSIFCFDGTVGPERDVSTLESLNREGLFVVRSPGGNAAVAVKIATLLEEKNATVVIYDYCMSACASSIFIAAARTYVLKDAIVAWHYGWRAWSVCEDTGDGIERRNSVGARWLPNGGFCYETQQQHREARSVFRSFALPFYTRRIIDLKRFNFDRPPQGGYISSRVRSRTWEAGTTPDVFWMWNPRYHKSTLRTEVVYEKYPDSQDDVDALMRRFLGTHYKDGYVLHDP